MFVIEIYVFKLNADIFVVLTKAGMMKKLMRGKVSGMRRYKAKNLVENFWGEIYKILKQGQQILLSSFRKFKLIDKRE